MFSNRREFFARSNVSHLSAQQTSSRCLRGDQRSRSLAKKKFANQSLILRLRRRKPTNHRLRSALRMLSERMADEYHHALNHDHRNDDDWKKSATIRGMISAQPTSNVSVSLSSAINCFQSLEPVCGLWKSQQWHEGTQVDEGETRSEAGRRPERVT